MKNITKTQTTLFGLLAVTALVSGCVPQGYQRTPMATPAMSNPSFQPAGAVPMMAQQQQRVMPSSSQTAPMFQPQVSRNSPSLDTQEVENLRQRLERMERAMIRLDRRMQLLERNELARITSDAMNGQGSQSPTGSFQPMSFSEPSGAPKAFAPQEMPSQTLSPQPYQKPFTQNGGARFQPVAGASLIGDNVAYLNSQSVGGSVAPQSSARSSLPSLADKGAEQSSDSSVSIWTIDYEPTKVWPERSQLVGSREVVEALQGENKVTLFARGGNPSSREFRERVRAISKYLAKVSDVEDVVISSMKAEHMGEDTIEVLATR